jgi:hypothetical protein
MSTLDGSREDGAQEGVVHHYEDLPLVIRILVRDLAGGGDVRHQHRGIGWGFQVDHLHRGIVLHQGLHLLLSGASEEGLGADLEGRQEVAEEILRAAVDGVGEHQRVAGLQEGQAGAGDGAHARREDGGVLGAIPGGDLGFQDLAVGIVHPGVDEGWALALLQGVQAVGDLEGALALGGGLEDERGGPEDRRGGRALGALGIVALGEDRGLGFHGTHGKLLGGSRIMNGRHFQMPNHMRDLLGIYYFLHGYWNPPN